MKKNNLLLECVAMIWLLIVLGLYLSFVIAPKIMGKI